jgi:galactose-1-phosphate uridylyltransferase
MKLRHMYLGILSVLVFYSLSNAQSRTNFEIVDSLIHISVNEISKNLRNDGTYNLIFNSSEDYSILKPKVMSYLQQYEVELKENDKGLVDINYNMNEASISYSEIFKDGLFGNYLVKRRAEIVGSYFTTYENSINRSIDFNYNLEDSVLYSEISRIENIAYSFTTSEVPEEPFFSSTLEPVIAIGTAAVAAYLFFNIRSK